MLEQNKDNKTEILFASVMAVMNLLILASVGGLIWLVYLTITRSIALQTVMRGGFFY